MEIIGRRSLRALRKEFFGEDNEAYGIRQFKYNEIDCVLDLGANIGLFSMQARFLFPTARVIAVEPSQENYDVMVRNVQHLMVEPHKVAFGDGSTYSMFNRGKSIMYTFNDYVVPAEDKETCKSETVDWFFKEFDIPTDNTMVKIDIEGAETHLMDQDISHLKLCKCISIELHGRRQSVSFAAFLEKEFKDTHHLHWRKPHENASYKLNHVVIVRKDFLS